MYQLTALKLRLTLSPQILSVTCDNASNNDTMIQHLSTLIEYFPGAANQTRCFAHILNLVVKSVLRQFDTPKKAADSDGDSGDLDDASNALAALAQELEDTRTEVDDGTGSEEDDDNDEIGGEDDSDDGPGEERDGMSEAEVDELVASLVPVRLMLTKASRFEFRLVYNLI
jgi:hypothetical protein